MLVDSSESTHNYIDFNRGIIRKGAISAEEGEALVIPLNMRDGIILGVGKGNKDWNYSVPHGAGRKMTRSQAKEKVTLSLFKKSMNGIYSSSVNKSTLDESPFAYKNPKKIIEQIGESVEILDYIKPILNIKA